MSTVPVPEGAVAVRLVALVTTTLVAAIPPKLTVVLAMRKLLPDTVTLSPPALLPDVGLTAVTVGVCDVADGVENETTEPEVVPPALVAEA